jgi:XTP/dITP diphosphohydrolase
VLVLATRNAGKLRELRPIFEGYRVPVIDLVEAGVPETPDEASVEIHGTFEENALAKARYYFARCGGRDVVADDSGLVVDALAGEPGVRSKRWSGRADLEGIALDRANNEKLLRQLRGVSERGARFVCAAAWHGAGGELVTRGEVIGRIVEQASGAQGFGYDPYFFADELAMTMADATVEAKRAVSHRGRAFDALARELRVMGLLPPVLPDA